MIANRNNICSLIFMLFAVITINKVYSGELKTENVVYYKGVKGFLARPADSEKHPGLILIHEWWGLNDNIRENARKFANLDYVALAVDLYNGHSATTREKARELAGGVRNNMEEAFENLKKAIDFLRNQSESVVPERIASVGWCFGGGWSYNLAKNNLGVKASIIYYGRFNPKDDLSKMRAKLLGHFAENDRVIRIDSVKEFQAQLITLNSKHEIYIYPNTGHGFANSKGDKYDKEAAELAWERTVEFLKKFL